MTSRVDETRKSLLDMAAVTETEVPVEKASKTQIVIDRVIKREDECPSSSPMSPMTPQHPFEDEIMAPLRQSRASLEKMRLGASTLENELGLLRSCAEGMLGFISDTLAKAKSESQVRSEEVKLSFEEMQSNEIKRVPVHILVHDLRNPLTGIMGYLDLLEESEDPKCLSGLEKAYELLDKTARTMDTNEVRLIVVPKTFELRRLMQDVGCKTETIDRQVAVRFRFPELILKADLQKLDQVLTNLISNAIKFSPKPGQVAVNVIPVDKRGNEVKLRFEVIDCGEGMDKKTKAKLFQLYGTGSSAKESSLPSTGIGLYLSQEFIKAMGGEIQVESEVGQGAKFFFDLELPLGKTEEILPSPADQKEKASRVRRIQKDGGFKNKNVRILSADDVPLIGKLYERLLKTVGFVGTYKHVLSGEDALKAFPVGYDIVILDMHMDKEGMTGLEAARTIHKLAKKESFPIIIATADAPDELVKIAEVAKIEGMNIRILTKPVEKKDLIGLIDELVQL